MHTFTSEDEAQALLGIEQLPQFTSYSSLVLAGKLGDIHSVLRLEWEKSINSNMSMAKTLSEIMSAIELGNVAELEGSAFLIFNQVLGKAMAYQRP